MDPTGTAPMTTGQSQPAKVPRIEKAPGIAAETARRFLGNRLSVIGLLVAVLIMLTALLADLLAPYPRDFAFFSAMLADPKDPRRPQVVKILKDFSISLSAPYKDPVSGKDRMVQDRLR